MIDLILQNIETEMRMLSELANYVSRIPSANPTEQRLLIAAANALKRGIKLINNNVPQLLAQVPSTQKLPVQNITASSSKPPQIPPNAQKLQHVKFRSANADVAITLQEKDREQFLRELSINEQAIRKLMDRPVEIKEQLESYQAASGYFKAANKLFLNTANKIIEKGYFKTLSVALRKANLDILFGTYIAMILFTLFIFFLVAIIIAIGVFFISPSLNPPFFNPVSAEGLTFMRFLKVMLIPIFTPLIVFLALYLYPMTEQNSITKKIDQELPFAVIHMSAISGSGIEPTQIFKIIGLSKEYPSLRKEIRKVLNQINLYGHDLVTSLKNVASTTPSLKLAELFSGVSTTITSGGDLSTFFSKRAETLLIAYRLEREKYTRLAETFMDVYISLVIAAPMILMIVLVLISVSGLNSIPPLLMTILIIFIIGVLNAIFLGFLHIKQPNY